MTRQNKEQTTTIAAIAPSANTWWVEEVDVVLELGEDPSLWLGFGEL